MTVDWVVNVEDEEQSYRAKEHAPLGNEVKLFESCIQQDGTVSWRAGTYKHRPPPWPLPRHDFIIVDTCSQYLHSICARSHMAEIDEEGRALGKNSGILPVDHNREKKV